MYPRDIRVENPTEALIVEQALAMYRELKRTADAAPDGQVLAQAEKLAVMQGRELTRKNLEAVLGEQAQEVEKKGRAADGVPTAARDTTAAGGRCVAWFTATIGMPTGKTTDRHNPLLRPVA